MTRILVIEDDVAQALNLKIGLQEHGYGDVDIAYKLQDVLDLLATTFYDIVFCEIMLPDADCINLLSKYLSPDIAPMVVICSAAKAPVLKLTQGMCNQLGYICTVIEKPYDIDEIACETDKLIKLHSQQDREVGIDVPSEYVIESLGTDKYYCVYQPQFSLPPVKSLVLKS